MRVVDLFSGCGGLSLGFQEAGMEIVAAYENWLPAINVYTRNVGDHVHRTDLSDVAFAIESIARHRPRMIIGGPPCQDFSSAGKRDEDNGRGDLTVSYAHIVEGVRPEWFVMENVSAITRTNKLAQAKEIFKACGYGLTQVVLNAALCGVPQKRKRFFLIGRMGAEDGFMADFIGRRLAAKELTMKEYFGDEMKIEYYYRHPRSYARRGIFSVDEPSPTIRGVNRPLPQGYQLHPGDPVKSLEGIRPLTTEERGRIQTFPQGFTFFGTKSDVEQMIGNAVPVNLARFVASAINDYIRD